MTEYSDNEINLQSTSRQFLQAQSHDSERSNIRAIKH